MASPRDIKLFRDLERARKVRWDKNFAAWCDHYEEQLDYLYEWSQIDLSYEEFCRFTFANTDRPLTQLRTEQKALWIRKLNTLIRPESATKSPVTSSPLCSV